MQMRVMFQTVLAVAVVAIGATGCPSGETSDDDDEDDGDHAEFAEVAEATRNRCEKVSVCEDGLTEQEAVAECDYTDQQLEDAKEREPEFAEMWEACGALTIALQECEIDSGECVDGAWENKYNSDCRSELLATATCYDAHFGDECGAEDAPGCAAAENCINGYCVGEGL